MCLELFFITVMISLFFLLITIRLKKITSLHVTHTCAPCWLKRRRHISADIVEMNHHETSCQANLFVFVKQIYNHYLNGNCFKKRNNAEKGIQYNVFYKV